MTGMAPVGTRWSARGSIYIPLIFGGLPWIYTMLAMQQHRLRQERARTSTRLAHWQARRTFLMKGQQMLIALVAPLAEAVPPKLYGGTERVVSWLAERARSARAQSDLVCKQRIADGSRPRQLQRQAVVTPSNWKSLSRACLQAPITSKSAPISTIPEQNLRDSHFFRKRVHRLGFDAAFFEMGHGCMIGPSRSGVCDPLVSLELGSVTSRSENGSHPSENPWRMLQQFNCKRFQRRPPRPKA